MRQAVVGLVVGVVVGAAGCWLVKDAEQKQTPDLLGGKIGFRNQIENTPNNATYQPYSMTVDGQITKIGNPPESMSDIWLFSLADGRIVIAAKKED